MATPSSLYAEDESARQTLANGTVLKWTKKNSAIYPTANVDTDRSICYCNWKGELDYANRGFHQWQGGCVSGDDLGHNGCEGSGFENLHANSLKQNEFGQPRMDGLYTGVVLTNANGDGAYVWGYNPEVATCVNSSNGGDRRYLLDMDVNKMIFNITFNVYDKADFDAIDYINTNNPESNQLPNQHNITLKQLYENPDDYYVASFSWGTTYVYGENTSDHWRSAQVYPAHIINGETVGQFKGTGTLSVFGQFYTTGTFSYDNSDPRNPNAHPNFGGGGSTPVIYNNMSAGYFLGCGEEINLNPVYSYQAVGTSAETIAQYRWGSGSSWNHNAYVNQEFFDYGGSVIWCAYGAHAYYNVNTSESKYREYFFSTRKMLKGQYALDYVASFGLYFASEAFDPDTVNLTPETLGDDSRIMLGEMSADGTTTGRWITDIDSYHGPNKDGKTSNPDYDPSSGGGGDGDDDSDWDNIPINGAGIGGGSAFCRFYYCTEAELAKLRTWTMGLSQSGDPIPAGFDPKSNILGLTVFPFTLSGDGPTTIKFTTNGGIDPVTQQEMPRAVDSGVGCEGGAGATVRILNAAIDVPATMRNRGEPWLDYESYIELYIPLCGIYQVDPQVCIGRTIHVEIFLDPVSGTVMGIAWVAKEDGKCIIAQGSGTPGVQIPVAVGNYGLAQAARVQNTLAGFGNTATSAISTTMVSNTFQNRAGERGLTGIRRISQNVTAGNRIAAFNRGGGTENGVSGAALGFAGILSSVQHWVSARQIANSPGTSASGGFSGSMAEWCGVFTPYVKVVRPKFRKPDNYKHTCGEPEVTTRKLNSVGYAVCINPDVSGLTNATEAERAAVYQFLSTGVYYK